jgi:hypothetical protein
MSVSSERTKFEHVSLDTNGVPVIVGTNMMVIEIVLKKAAYGWSPEEMYFQHPSPDTGADILCISLLLGSSRRT